jgi:hypothetical protein
MISFEINQKDVENMMKALTRLELKAKRLESQHPFSCANDYQVLVKKNLLTQKFALTYPPYSERYARWKSETMRMGSHFWMLFGDLFRAITVFKIGKKDWMAGVPSRIFDKGGKSMFGMAGTGKPKRIAMYGSVVEKKRPLFSPTADEYKKTGWPKQGERDLRELGRQWR